MTQFNAQNEIIKKKYLKEMEEADGYSLKTILSASNAINRYEKLTDCKCFKESNSDVFFKFKTDLLKSKNKKGKDLSLSTIEHTLSPVKRFFKWLVKQDGYKSKKKSFDFRYLELSRDDRRKIRTVPKFKEYYKIEEITKALDFKPKNEVEMRDRALIAILACTAMRHESIITSKIGNFDLRIEAVFQDSKTMKVKGGGFINTKVVAIDEGLKQIIIDWVSYLKDELKFTDNDPIFPKEKLQHDKYNQFVGGVALSREHMKNHHSIPSTIERIFARIGVKYNNPHSFRDMLVAYVVKNYGIQELIAISRNLGHKNISITLGSYYQPTPEQQFDILSKIGKPKEEKILPNEIMDFVRMQMDKNKT